MMSAKFSDCLTPSTPPLHLDLIYTIKFTQPPLLIRDYVLPPCLSHLCPVAHGVSITGVHLHCTGQGSRAPSLVLLQGWSGTAEGIPFHS